MASSFLGQEFRNVSRSELFWLHSVLVELDEFHMPMQGKPLNHLQQPSSASTDSSKKTSFGRVPQDSEDVAELHKEILDLKIANRGKDMFVEQLTKERSDFLDKLVESSRKVGELETRLLQLDGPRANEHGKGIAT